MAVHYLIRFLFLYTVKIGRNRLFSVAKIIKATKSGFCYRKIRDLGSNFSHETARAAGVLFATSQKSLFLSIPIFF